ncbi:MAG: hypothetical protein NTW49_02380 [Bacteroidia bacterium]|nr:hypothetical protein [Bacteroidia bacterium]
MSRSKIFLILFLQFIFNNLFAANYDSLFIEKVKAFAFREFETELTGEFYTRFSEEDNPYLYLFISLPDKIKCPREFKSDYQYIGTDEEKAKEKETELISYGYQVFCYKTYANYFSELNKRFLNYTKEAQSFIILHELTHHYIRQQDFAIPYEYEEALCDVIGNYGTIIFAQADPELDIKSAENQVKTNEKIYLSINKYISKINNNPVKALTYHTNCEKKISAILLNCNTFQKDRFDFHINNAYLLKNENYSKNYFLLKKVLNKQKSISKLFDIMKDLPKCTTDCNKYLEKFE